MATREAARQPRLAVRYAQRHRRKQRIEHDAKPPARPGATAPAPTKTTPKASMILPRGTAQISAPDLNVAMG